MYVPDPSWKINGDDRAEQAERARLKEEAECEYFDMRRKEEQMDRWDREEKERKEREQQ
jgi:hypothetical protein